MGKQLAKVQTSPGLLQQIGNRYGLDPTKVYDTLCKTAFKDAKTQEQVIALLVVANEYHLNPFTREIYAFPDKSGGIVPVVGIDGWLRIINDHPQFDGMEFLEADDTTTVGQSNPAPEWIECIIYRKDRSRPTHIREYLTECYRTTPAWNQTTARMLRHRAIMQAARVAFGFGGIVDPNDAELAADFDALPINACVVEVVKPPLGARDYKKLLTAAKRYGYTEADVLATAETAGYEGAGPDMPSDLADRLFAGMQANPKEEQPAIEAAAVDEDGIVQDEPAGYRTPLLGGDGDA